MRAVGVVIVPEGGEFLLKVGGVPIDPLVQTLLAQCADEPFDKRMRYRNVRDGGDWVDAQDPQIGLPAVELEQGIMISTEPPGPTLPRDGLVEHTAERWTVDGNGLHAKADDPAGKLIHDDQDPVTPQQDRFGPEQVQAPETVFGMTQEGEPRRSVLTTFGAVVGGQNSADHILVEIDTKGLGQVLGDL